jgi:hypothetical protein
MGQARGQAFVFYERPARAKARGPRRGRVGLGVQIRRARRRWRSSPRDRGSGVLRRGERFGAGAAVTGQAAILVMRNLTLDTSPTPGQTAGIDPWRTLLRLIVEEKSELLNARHAAGDPEIAGRSPLGHAEWGLLQICLQEWYKLC